MLRHLHPRPLLTASLACTLTWGAACGASDDVVSTSLPSGGGDASPGQVVIDDAGNIVPTTMDASVSMPTPNEDGCNKAEIRFESKTPAVFILVDRSSSMFERNLWEPLKNGVLSIVQQLDRDVHFGFSSYTGAAGGMCPDLTSSVSVKAENYAAIKAAYDGIAAPKYKGETPTSRAIDEVTKILAKEPEGTPKFILLVTDGEPDFCDDPNVTCSRDAVVASAQAAKALGIGTFIFSVGGSVDKNHLQDVANAGVGFDVEDRQQAVFYQCNGGKARYAMQAGMAPFYEPNVNDQSALVGALSGVVAGVRSCVFDLSGKVAVDLALANMGVVEIDGKRIPFNTADGFRMNSRTQLELLGGACAQLRKPETQHVAIDFPCEAIIVL